MLVEFDCPACGAPQKAANYLAGRNLRCYQCRAPFTVPAVALVPPSLPSPGAAFEISTTSFDLPPE